ncbi:MAG: APC family permease [Acidobacteria bacterium]|nr:APC family permease [Acidobacteriota bacterium]
MAESANSAKLERGLGLAEATSLNMIDMVGIGPFVVVPLVIQDMGGPQALAAWVAGAALSLLDGCVWAELGAAMPEAGGSYVFLREAYGAKKWGRLMSFLFIWQTMFQAPLVMASAAIGFGEYLMYLVPLGPVAERAVRGALIVFLLFLLYRKITTIGKISMLIWAGVVATMVWLIFGGVTHFKGAQVFTYAEGAWNFSWAFFAGLGAATVRTIYTYLGYYNVCHLGAEIRDPQRNIPKSIFISIIGIAVLYLLMQTSILGVVPWQEAQTSKFIVSTFVERIYGTGAAKFATVMILWIAFGSLFALTLGYSRVPYAAAVDGTFFSAFARVHPTKHFPHVSLLALGATALVFSLLFRLREVISAILAMRILVQFIGGAVGLMVLRRRWPPKRFPFKMWFYPLPVVLVVAAWAAVFVATGSIEVLGARIDLRLAAMVLTLTGAGVFLARARVAKEWPFEK